MSGMYPDDVAERFYKQDAGRKWRPSNGTEGAIFADWFCDRCTKEPDCDIRTATMIFGVNEPGYPQEWQISPEGQPTCTAFEREKPPTPAEPHPPLPVCPVCHHPVAVRNLEHFVRRFLPHGPDGGLVTGKPCLGSGALAPYENPMKYIYIWSGFAWLAYSVCPLDSTRSEDNARRAYRHVRVLLDLMPESERRTPPESDASVVVAPSECPECGLEGEHVPCCPGDVTT